MPIELTPEDAGDIVLKVADQDGKSVPEWERQISEGKDKYFSQLREDAGHVETVSGALGSERPEADKGACPQNCCFGRAVDWRLSANVNCYGN